MNINYYNPYVREELMLYHHGVLGQRWGRKNGPPYPLDAGDHSASEKRAGWRKSLAGGMKTFGRGSIKAAKAIGRGSVKAAKFTNKVLVRTNLKPKILMSEAEMNSQIQRLHKKAEYKNALKGRFGDVTQYEKKKGEDFISRMMKSIGDDVLIPTATGLITYKLANTMAKATGDKAPSMVETVFGKRVGFRDNERYISKKVLGKLYDDNSKGPHLIEDTRKGNKNGGNKKEDDKNKDGNDGGNKQKQDGNQQKQDGNGGGNQPKKKKQKPQENRNDQKDQDKSSEAKAESSKEEKKDTPKPADSDKTPESNSSPSPSKNSLTDRTRSLNARVGELYEKYNGAYRSRDVQRQVQKEKKESGTDYSSIWNSTPPSVRKKLNSNNVKNTLSKKMNYFYKLTNPGSTKRIAEYKDPQKYKQAYEKRLDNQLNGKPIGSMPFSEYTEWLKRQARL